MQKTGYCGQAGGNSTCQKFATLIGETGSNFTLPADEEYFANMVKFMKLEPPADGYTSAKFNRWMWWCVLFGGIAGWS